MALGGPGATFFLSHGLPSGRLVRRGKHRAKRGMAVIGSASRRLRLKRLVIIAVCLMPPSAAFAQASLFKPYSGGYGATVRSQYGTGALPTFWWDQLMACSAHVGKIGVFLADKDKPASDQFITGSQYIGAAAFRRAVLDSGMNETIAAQTLVGPYPALAESEMDVLMAEAETRGALDAFIHAELERCDPLVAQYTAEFPNDLPE